MIDSSGCVSARGRERRGVVLVGVGTLGAPVLELMVRQSLGGGWPVGDGRGPIVVIDFDRVELHNPEKASLLDQSDIGLRKVDVAEKWAGAVAPECRLVTIPQPVEHCGIGPFLQAEAALICADTYTAKINAFRKAWLAGVPLIVIGELAGEGSLNGRYRYYFPGPDQPCLECTYSGPEYGRLGIRFSCSAAGNAGANGGGNGSRGPITRLSAAYRIAASMVEDCERLLPELRGRDASTDDAILRAAEVRSYPSQRRTLTLWPRRNPNCCFDHRILEIEPLAPSANAKAALGLTVGGAFAHGRERLPAVQGLLLDQMVATAWRCENGHEWRLLRRLSVDPPRCAACGAPGLPDDATRYVELESLAAAAEQQLVGDIVPPGDVLTFVGADSIAHLALPPPREWAPGTA